MLFRLIFNTSWLFLSIYFLSYIKLFKVQETTGAVETGRELSKSLKHNHEDPR